MLACDRRQPLPPLGRHAARSSAATDTRACPRCARRSSRWAICLPTADAADPTATLYSAALATAVRRFQVRTASRRTACIGKGTLDALDAPVAARIEQIALSLERLRWLPDFAAGPLIAVNIPSFELWALADATGTQRATLSMPVVVGRAMRSETPVFIERDRYVETAPTGMSRPASCTTSSCPDREEPSYLRREDMEVVRNRA